MSVQEMAKIIEENGALLRAADKFNNVELIEYCTEYLKRNLSVENVMDILVSAKLTNQKELFDIASLFALENRGKLAPKSEYWKDLEKTNPKLIDDTMMSAMFA